MFTVPHRGTMAHSLHQTFNNLSLRPEPQRPSHQELNRELNRDPTLPVQLTIPQINAYGRRLYYGFLITEDWTKNYGQRESRKRGYYPDPDPGPTDFFDVSMCLKILSETSGIRTLTFKEVFDQGEPITPLITQPIFPTPESRTQILVLCSSRRRWFEGRPSQAESSAGGQVEAHYGEGTDVVGFQALNVRRRPRWIGELA
jgi:hypothetical protein